MTKTTNRYSPDVRRRAVRMVLDGVGEQRGVRTGIDQSEFGPAMGAMVSEEQRDRPIQRVSDAQMLGAIVAAGVAK